MKTTQSKPTHPAAEAASSHPVIRSGERVIPESAGDSPKVPTPAAAAPTVQGEPFALVPPPAPGSWDPRSKVIEFPRSAAPEPPEQMWIVLYTQTSHRHARRRGRSAEQVKERLRSTLAKRQGEVLGEIVACFPAREMLNREWFPAARPPEAADLGAGI
jgi:hypothetical protein